MKRGKRCIIGLEVRFVRMECWLAWSRLQIVINVRLPGRRASSGVISRVPSFRRRVSGGVGQTLVNLFYDVPRAEEFRFPRGWRRRCPALINNFSRSPCRSGDDNPAEIHRTRVFGEAREDEHTRARWLRATNTNVSGRAEEKEGETHTYTHYSWSGWKMVAS